MPTDWKPELDAILGSRHGGASEAILNRLRDLERRNPNVAEILYQVAWTSDTLGKDSDALVSYEKAVALGLNPNEHAGALVGMTACLLRTGQNDRAVQVLNSARTLFPENREFEAFMALALHAQGKYSQALQILLVVLVETSEDPGIAAYQRTLRHLSGKMPGL